MTKENETQTENQNDDEENDFIIPDDEKWLVIKLLYLMTFLYILKLFIYDI